jgi:putative phage-type endonuclease
LINQRPSAGASSSAQEDNAMGTDRERWLEERRTGIGGSDVAAILGISPWKTPLQVYEEKLGLALPTEENEAMKWGTLLEPVVMAEFSRRTGKTVVPGGTQIIRHRDMPWMFCTPDGLISGYDEGLECKTARSAHGWGEPEGDEVPPAYLCQVTQCMIVTGRPAWWVAVLIGGSDFRIRRVELDAVLANEIIQSCADFWHHNIEKRIPPAAQTTEEARRKFPSVSQTGSAMAFASGQTVEDCETLVGLKARAKAIKADIDKTQARIMDAMGGAESLKHGHEILATWKQSSAKSFDLEGFRVCHPEIAERFTKINVSRRFLLKGAKE